jgi:type II secretory pathway component PulM
MGLNTRERRMVSIAALVVAAAMVYALVWHPLRTAIARTQVQVTDMRSELAWMQRAAGKLQAGEQGAVRRAPRMDGSLLEVIDRVSRKQGIRSNMDTLAQHGSGQVDVDMKQVEFDRFVPWLGALHQQGIRVVTLDLVNSGAGRVAVKARFERSRHGGSSGS